MKKIILILALGFFTFSTTSLMAQTPKTTNTEAQQVQEVQQAKQELGCVKSKQPKGQARKVKGDGKYIKYNKAQGRKNALHPKRNTVRGAQAQGKKNYSKASSKKQCVKSKKKKQQTQN